MNVAQLLLVGWDASYVEEDWYPPLRDALNGLTAEQAAWRPDGSVVNTIWENVNHLIFYKERLLKRWTGEETAYPPGLVNEDTFVVESRTEEAWRQTLARLDAVHNSIRGLLAAASAEELERRIPDKPLDHWLYNLLVHDAYHTGAIIQLRKLQGSWPARRSVD
jgi:hypothetical protein